MSTAVEGRSGPILGLRGMLLNFAIALSVALGVTAIIDKRPLSDVLMQGKPWLIQCASGVAIALLLMVPACLAIIRVHRLRPFRRQVIDILSRADLSGLNPLWFGLCAGVGEEMLFRGALQPHLGLWLTSIIFTALHFQTGGFQTMNRMKAIYAILVFLASLLLGMELLRLGLIAAVVTHTVIDVVALSMLQPTRVGT